MMHYVIAVTYLFFFVSLNQQFIIQSVVVDHSSYNITTYIGTNKKKNK